MMNELNLIDTHCHLDKLDEAALGSLGEIRARAAEQGVGHIITISVNMVDLPKLVAIRDELPGVSLSVGVHPSEPLDEPVTEAALVTAAKEAGAVAIGETGLDYYYNEGDLTWQRERFRTHIRAAKTCGLPLVIHSRDAREDTLAIMTEEGADSIGGVLHCFTETWAMAEAALAMGFYISFSGIVTFKNATELQAVAQRVPLERILIETDAPYLTPVPYRGKPNQPAHVAHVAQKLAELRGITVAEVATATTENAQRCFNLSL